MTAYAGLSRYPHLLDTGPMIFDIKDFQYTYKCGHCGHEWSEKQETDKRIN